MTDNSNFVLRYDIDEDALDTGKCVSEVFYEGGFEWIASVEKCNRSATISLRCGVDHNGPWKCEVKFGVYIAKCGEEARWIENVWYSFSDNSRVYITDLPWAMLDDLDDIDDEITLEFRVNIISSERSDMFSAPNNKSNVILKIGREKLHVSKEQLSFHSPVFDTLFFGDFAEKGKEEVEIKDVVCQEFLDLLHVIYMEVAITDRTVVHIVKLADQFQMERVMNLSAMHLIQSKGFDVDKKLLIADQYNLSSLKVHCLQSFTMAEEMKDELEGEWSNFSGKMKDEIMETAWSLL